MLKKDWFYIDKKRKEAKFKNEAIAVEKNPTPDDYKLMSLIFGKGVTPVFFSSNKSHKIKLMSSRRFMRQMQFAENYLMPVTLKDCSKTVTTTYKDKDTGEDKTREFISSRRDNINSVRSLVVDIDIHDNELLEDVDFDKLIEGFRYYAKEYNVDPTAIVATGRGLQCHYVLRDPIYRNNAKKIDSCLRFFLDSIKDIIDREILPNIFTDKTLRCDKAINPINQKVRVPGTYNFKAGDYAHVKYINEDKLYNMGQWLTWFYGEYQPKEKVKKTNRKKRRSGNNGNGKSNLKHMLERRIRDISNAMKVSSEVTAIGFRNNGYFTLLWQYAEMIKRDYITEGIAIEEVWSLDSSLSCPYFRGKDDVEKMLMSVERCRADANSKKLTNKSIEDYCIALDIAREEGMNFETFFKKTVVEERKERREAKTFNRENRRNKTLNLIKKGKDIKTVAKEVEVTRNTVYADIAVILSDVFGVNWRGLTGSLERLRKELEKEKKKRRKEMLAKLRKTNSKETIERESDISGQLDKAFDIYILLSAETVNTGPPPDEKQLKKHQKKAYRKK